MKFLKSLFASSRLLALDSASIKTFTESWPEIKAYYEVFSKTFHSSEKVNIEALKSESGLLTERAEALLIENLPAAYRNPKTIETLLTLKKQTNLVAVLVRENSPEAEIKSAAIKLKDTFHAFIDFCLSEK